MINAQRFSAANARSPVVHAEVTSNGRGDPVGCFYRLANGETFNLTAEDCQPITPRWAHLESIST
jgi:hypothetical protein